MISFANPLAQYQSHQTEIDAAIHTVLNSGHYILGEQVAAFENEFARYLGLTNAVGVASGTDALVLALMALGVGRDDEVILPSMTATATANAVKQVGATPVFVDIEKNYYTIDPVLVEKAITEKTKAIIAVHLYGQPADMFSLLKIAKQYQVKLIEDCAQAVGAYYQKKPVGNFSDIACFSFFPTKNLGAMGDGGAIATNNNTLAERIRQLRQYGWDANRDSQFIGMNSRLDELQAAILRVKLRYLNKDIEKRNQIARHYDKLLKSFPFVLPAVRHEALHAYHLYVIQCEHRGDLVKQLHEKNIMVGMHYPKAAHQMPAYSAQKTHLPNTEKLAARVISLPIFPELSITQQKNCVEMFESCLCLR